MEKLQALQILNSRSVVSEPGKYTTKVTSVNFHTSDTGVEGHIINFNLMTSHGASLAKKALKEGDYDAAVGKGTSMSTKQLDRQFVPSKGETVDVEVSTITNKDGIDILVVSSIIPRKAIAAAKFSFSMEDELADEPAIV